MRFPVKATFAVRRVKGDFILHDRGTDAVHRLNSVAAVIWQLCDGTRDRRAIIAEVAAIFGKSPPEVAADVDDTIARFIDSGLVHAAADRRETELLVRCVRTALGGGAVDDDRRQLGKDVDWADIELTAIHHGVMPLLYRGLRTDHQDAVPIEVMHRLEQQFSANAERNQLLFQELLELVALFEAQGIPAVPFKGPPLALSLYGDVSLRQFGDLDILVRAEHVHRAKDLLAARACRFRLSTDDSVLAEYDRRDHTVMVDLHWTFGAKRYRFPIDIEQVWSRVERVPMGGAAVLQLAPVDQFRMLSAHGAKHCWTKLGWISDIAAFIERHRTTLDWRDVMEQSRKAGGARLTFLGARLASDVLGAVMPDELVSAMEADAAVGPLATTLQRRLFASVEKTHSARGAYGAVEGDLLYIRTRERWRDKLPSMVHLTWRPFRRLLTGLTPNAHDRDVIALPGHVAFAYYLVRPIRLTSKYWIEFVQRFHYLRK